MVAQFSSNSPSITTEIKNKIVNFCSQKSKTRKQIVRRLTELCGQEDIADRVFCRLLNDGVLVAKDLGLKVFRYELASEQVKEDKPLNPVVIWAGHKLDREVYLQSAIKQAFVGDTQQARAYHASRRRSTLYKWLIGYAETLNVSPGNPIEWLKEELDRKRGLLGAYNDRFHQADPSARPKMKIRLTQLKQEVDRLQSIVLANQGGG